MKGASAGLLVLERVGLGFAPGSICSRPQQLRANFNSEFSLKKVRWSSSFASCLSGVSGYTQHTYSNIMSYSSYQVSSIPSLFSSLSPPSNINISSSHARIFFFWQNSANSSSHSTTGLLLSPRLLASTSTDFPDSSLLNSQSLYSCL